MNINDINRLKYGTLIIIYYNAKYTIIVEYRGRVCFDTLSAMLLETDEVVYYQCSIGGTFKYRFDTLMNNPNWELF